MWPSPLLPPTHLGSQGLASGTPMSNWCRLTPSTHTASWLVTTTCHCGELRSPLCMTLSNFRWGLILDQTASYRTSRMLWGSPQVSMGPTFPIPLSAIRGIWGVGPFSLTLQRGCLPVVWGFVSCLLQLYGLAPWGCTIPLWGGGFDSESTPLAWATGWRQPSGVCVTPVVVWGVSTGIVQLAGCRFPLSVSPCHIGLWC
jgi:hypothetical protein